MKRFTPKEDEFIRQNYLTMSLKQMGNKIDRAFESIHGRMKRLGLIVPPEILKQRHKDSFKTLSESGKVGRFKKGHVPANKGKKMSPHVYEKLKPTMFKPGNMPHNYIHNGEPYLYERKRKNGYLERLWFIQEGKNKRSAYMAYLCRKNKIDLTGKKPRLKKGFDHSRAPTMDDIIIVSNAKNMKLNSIHRYPEDVVKLIQINASLSRQIKKIKSNE